MLAEDESTCVVYGMPRAVVERGAADKVVPLDSMAEAIVQLRAIYLSGDFDRYWSFHIEKDQQRFIPATGASS